MKKPQQNDLNSSQSTANSAKNEDLHLQLKQLLQQLRNPEKGCPWDKQQNHQSLKKYLLEECYEVLEHLDPIEPVALKEELGDLLFQIYFHAQIAEEAGHFCIDDIFKILIEKMQRRHPHVFADEKIDKAEEVNLRWEEIKANEKKSKGNSEAGLLDDIPRHLPSLYKAYKIGKKAAQIGFDWTDSTQVLSKLDEEIGELKEALQMNDSKAISEELGDVLFTLSNLSRHLQLNPEEVLQQANQKFKSRFEFVEKKLLQIDKKTINLELLEQLWAEAKKSTASV